MIFNGEMQIGKRSMTNKVLTPPPASASKSVIQLPDAAPTKSQQVDSIPLAIGLSQSSGSCLDNADVVMEPCALVALRNAYSTALGLPLKNIILNSVTLTDGPALPLDPSGIANSATKVCTITSTVKASCASSRMLEGARSLASSSATVGASAVAPAGYSQAQVMALKTQAGDAKPEMSAVGSAMEARQRGF